MFECGDPLYVAQRNMKRAIEEARDAAAYISADQTAQWLKVNRPEMIASNLQQERL